MTKHTIELEGKRIKIVKVVQAVNNFSSIDKAIGFIIEDYAKANAYSKFIEDRQKGADKK